MNVDGTHGLLVDGEPAQVVPEPKPHNRKARRATEAASRKAVRRHRRSRTRKAEPLGQ